MPWHDKLVMVVWIVAAHLFCRHQVLMDSEMPVLKCEYCSFITEKRGRYDDHIKMHRNIRDMPCAQCGKLFVTKKTLRQHVIKVHRRVAAATTTAASSAAAPPPAPVRSFLLPANVEKLNEELELCDVAVVSAAETSTASQQLLTTPDATDTFTSSSLQSSTISSFDQITVESSATAPVEYQMLMPLATTAAADDAASVPQVAAAVSGAGPIIVGISLPPIDSVAAYQTFQPFDLQNARLVL